jgi:hypothetical protein
MNGNMTPAAGGQGEDVLSSATFNVHRIIAGALIIVNSGA